MKKKGNGLFKFIFIVMVLFLVVSLVLTKLGLVESGTTYAEGAEVVPTEIEVDNLDDNHLYIWKDATDKDIEAKNNCFLVCPEGNTNINYEDIGASGVNFTVWIPLDSDSSIPTLTRSDKLLFVSKKEVPDTFDFMRMYENGYSIGITSLVADASNHYYIAYANASEDDYKQYVNTKSDAKDLGGLLIEKLYLDKVGGMTINSEDVSEGGIVTGLTKGEQYVCEFYTGTYYQDYLLTASEHTFTEFEDFTCYGYEFLHSNCISIDIPDWLCSGYYYINGIGLFRFVDDTDLGTYSGEPYDENIAWNEPLIQYNEFGQVIFDPSKQTAEEEIVEEETVEEAVETTGNISNWSYTLPEAQESFSAEITLSELSNGEAAVLNVTRPDGTIQSFTECKNVIAVQLDQNEPGAYAFSLENIAGRSFNVLYSNGDTYSGVGEYEEPTGDDVVE